MYVYYLYTHTIYIICMYVYYIYMLYCIGEHKIIHKPELRPFGDDQTHQLCPERSDSHFSSPLNEHDRLEPNHFP